MADRSLRGMRLGASSLQSEEGVVFHERANHTYVCTQCERETVLTFAADAEVPEAWECRTCGAEALRRHSDATLAEVGPSGGKTPPPPRAKRLERRTIPELEELLEERLALLRARRGEDASGKRLSA